MQISLSAEDLTRVRFTISPLWETVTSVRALQLGTRMHRPWITDATTRILASRDERKQDHLRLLTTLIRPTGYIADSLTPTPLRQDTFEAGLAAVGAVAPELWVRDLDYLFATGLEEGRMKAVRAIRDDPESEIPRIVDALRWYWETAVEPFWPRLRGMLLADLDYRLALLAEHGIHQVFNTLHPNVRLTPDGIEVTANCDGSHHASPGNGLILIPSAFVWPRTLVLDVDPFVPTLTYAPRGVGRLWENTREVKDSPVAQLLGHTRAQILAQLDLPMTTTQLACVLDLAAGTINGHLKVMAASGLTDTIRAGREVFYRRADLGEDLLARA